MIKSKRLLSGLVLAVVLVASATEACEIFYVSKGDFENYRKTQQDIRTLSRALNSALKTSYEFANKIDHYTLGLASAILLGGHSLEDIKPSEWDRLRIGGKVVFQDAPFNATPLRGAKMTISDNNHSVEFISGTSGEFEQAFHKLVPYKRFRLFPTPILTMRGQYVVTAKIPLEIKIESKLCSGSLRLTEAPLEPMIIIATPKM